ncbi:MAG: hypothetical protein ACQRW7_08305 [Caulobacterales bacterium]|uniref:hypothetical protein n=1 Tax=Glycocaulis sp. TaxID=1969725 RepID=UPI003FA1203C
MVARLGAANTARMIGVDNQGAGPFLVWLERALFVAGGLCLAGLSALRIASGEGLAYPQSMAWVLASGALAAACALLYWRVNTRLP